MSNYNQPAITGHAANTYPAGTEETYGRGGVGKSKEEPCLYVIELIFC